MSSRPKRGLSLSSQPSVKRNKLNTANILNAFTANVNGAKSRLTSETSTVKPSAIEVPTGQNARRSERKPVPTMKAAYMRTIVKSTPKGDVSNRKSLPKLSGDSQAKETKGQGSHFSSALKSQGDSSHDLDPVKKNPIQPKSIDKNMAAALDKVESEFVQDLGLNSSGDEGGEEDTHVQVDVSEGEDEEDASELIMEDITAGANKNPRRGGGSVKILKSDFADPKLAIFAKRCARMATCIVNMCPDDSLFCWPTFTEEMERLGNEGRADRFLESLVEVHEDPDVRDQFVRFMNYGTSAIRLDMGREARIRTCQFFGVPGSLNQNQIISSVQWLLKDRKYHHCQVDMEKRTTDGLPFRSPLLGLLLKGYLMEGRPRQDRLLIARLQRDERVPIPLIAMLTVLIGHALQEFSAGYKVQNSLSHTNIGSHFRAIMSTLSTLQEKAPAYVGRLQIDLYSDMMTLGPEIVPPQTYDYNALDAFGRQPNTLDEEESTNGEDQPEGGLETKEAEAGNEEADVLVEEAEKISSDG